MDHGYSFNYFILLIERDKDKVLAVKLVHGVDEVGEAVGANEEIKVGKAEGSGTGVRATTEVSSGTDEK